MTMRKAWWAVVVVLVGGLSANAQQGGGKAEKILAEIEAMKMPELDLSKREDRAYLLQYFQKRQEAMAKKAALIGDLYKSDPKNEKLVQLLPERWMTLANTAAAQGEIAKELEAALAGPADSPLRTEAAYTQMMLTIRQNRGDGKKALGAVEGFIKIAPKDERGPMLLYQVAQAFDDLSDQDKKGIYERIQKEYPDSQAAAEMKTAMRQTEGIGKPFELAFNEAITGKAMSMADLKGKVVVIDFWATWCGPCVAEMPKMKSLYAEYKPKGVEFIGVSLDSPESEGGLKALKDFVAKNKIEWPQYYQGNGWESEFSVSWGINAIPAVFVVDQQGNLYSTEARGKLEQIIPELLAKGGSSGNQK